MWTPEVTALIAFFGVLTSSLLSWFIASKTTTTEIRKQQLQLFQSYAERLQEKRLVSYPAAFSIMSDCAKQIRRRTLTWDNLADALSKVTV
jgi:hypothetical protein